MAGLKNKLFEKQVQVLSGYIFNSSHEVMSVDCLKLMFVQEVLESPEKWFVSHDKPEHMKNSCTFRIGVTVKIILRTVIPVENNRTYVSCMRFLQIPVLFSQQVIGAFIFSFIIPRIEIVGVRAEAFVQPGLGPGP
ncbi:hypothetical protein ES705_41231 [subsurface metagenome]